MDSLYKEIIEGKIKDVSYFDNFKRKHYVKPEHIKKEVEVFKQALRHNIKLDEIDLIAQKFPNESKLYLDYRNKNKRQFTKEIPQKIIQGVVNVLGHVDVKVVTNNVKVKGWLDSQPFNFKNSLYSFFEWAITCYIPVGFIDPNSIVVPMPEFVGEFEVVKINTIVIPHNRKYIDPKGNFIIILEKEKKEFICIDKLAYWKVTAGQFYQWELIYEHNMNELPYISCVGLMSFDESTEIEYLESLLSSAYEYLDESLVSFTTYQAVKAKLNPLVVRPGIQCNMCHGQTETYDENNKPVQCVQCKGTGLAKTPSAMDEFVVPPADTIQGDGKIPVKPEYINPDTAVAEFHAKDYKQLMSEAKKAYGIDPLIEQSESGEAMKKRLSIFEDFLAYLLYLTFRVNLKKYLQYVHKLLEPNPANWIDFPNIITPKRVEIKTPEILKENFNTAIGAEKIQAALDYYDHLYSDNPIMQRTMRLLVENYPSSIEEPDDYDNLILNGGFTRRDIAKGKRALVVIKKILSNPTDFEKTDEAILQLAETQLDILIPDQLIANAES